MLPDEDKHLLRSLSPNTKVSVILQQKNHSRLGRGEQERTKMLLAALKHGLKGHEAVQRQEAQRKAEQLARKRRRKQMQLARQPNYNSTVGTNGTTFIYDSQSSYGGNSPSNGSSRSSLHMRKKSNSQLSKKEMHEKIKEI